jgi:two-component system, response regulator PdtaR
MTYTAVVAEDEELIRSIAIDILVDAGFTVLEAEHAESALVHLEAQADTIHLLFTDINMPGKMNGLALAHHSYGNWPWIAVLISSARPSPAVHEMPTSSRFISKPYSVAAVTKHALELVGAA